MSQFHVSSSDRTEVMMTAGAAATTATYTVPVPSDRLRHPASRPRTEVDPPVR